MFDSVLTGGSAPKSRWGLGAIISVGVHAALLAAVLALGTRPGEAKLQEPEVKFFAAAPVAAAPAPPPPAAAAKPKVPQAEKKPLKKPTELVQPRQIPLEKPKEAEPEAAPAPVEADEPAGEPGGLPGGLPGALPGGTSVGGRTDEVLPFGEGMSRPIADPNNRLPPYTREALEAHIEGVMLLKCTITITGELQNCRVLKPLPHMDEVVLQAVSKWKFTPVKFEGRAVSVDYVIHVRLVMPK